MQSTKGRGIERRTSETPCTVKGMVSCSVAGCDSPTRRLSAELCARHYMKWYRHGDPTYTRPPSYEDFTGQRFGMLTVQYRTTDGGGYVVWVSRCDCGRERNVRAGELHKARRAGADAQLTCGDRAAYRALVMNYEQAHKNVKAERGPARGHPCVDCGGVAAQWSYDHLDPAELANDPRRPGPYSTDPAHYVARCVPCHKRFDLDHLALSAPGPTIPA